MRDYIKGYLDKYVKTFEMLNINVEALILFGSHARDTALVSSDVDIAVVMKEPLGREAKGLLRCLGDEIDEDIRVDLFFTTKEAINSAEGVFDTNRYIKEEGIVLWRE